MRAKMIPTPQHGGAMKGNVLGFFAMVATPMNTPA
jgi:hypothetical protein